jgi:ABC-2 type transport system ATP-binding protein
MTIESQSQPAAIDVTGLSYSYGERLALDSLDLRITAGEVFAVLGPNGGGKTTLFRLLSTLIPIQQGRGTIFGNDLSRDQTAVRRSIGVVFQAPSLDKKLTVSENIRLQAALYGVTGGELDRRETELLDQLGIADRAGERTETLSGGLRRRVELAKGMIHQPRLLLLDEPSTGLDPGARIDLWQYLGQLRAAGVTIVLTTHLLDEAERADRIAILDQGRLVALDTPDNLRDAVGGSTITIDVLDAERLVRDINSQLSLSASVVDGHVRLECEDGQRVLARLLQTFADRIQAITLAKPTLEDVFIQRTGHRFWQDREAAA